MTLKQSLELKQWQRHTLWPYRDYPEARSEYDALSREVTELRSEIARAEIAKRNRNAQARSSVSQG